MDKCFGEGGYIVPLVFAEENGPSSKKSFPVYHPGNFIVLDFPPVHLAAYFPVLFPEKE